ncbi:hypothetical protein CFOL_v3_01513 [Cephalotus follicularis]|uniref:Uncharacterized protein n=1 Tax=Cephalotus follicularis TaxID=3775 RepID=A0A1Q3AQF5_CEPFO|nr:hypothetical protein CFOL_v3_01513 [Cephalotus follicularis]
MTFLVVDTPSPYNVIIGHLGLDTMEAIVSTRHLLVKFLTRFGVGQIRGDQQAARQCYQIATKNNGKGKTLPIANVELRGELEPEQPRPAEDVKQLPLEESNLDKVFQIGFQLGEIEKEELITFLKDNKYVFSWSAEEVPGINLEIKLYKLSVNQPRPWTRQMKKHTRGLEL